MAKLPDFEAWQNALICGGKRTCAATASKVVSRLEERLGARLFNRSSPRLALTDAGQRLSGARDAARIGAARASDDVKSVAPYCRVSGAVSRRLILP